MLDPTSIRIGPPPGESPTLFSLATKERFGNIEGALNKVNTALSVGAFDYNNLRKGVFNLVDYIGLTLGSVQSANIFQQQVLASTGIYLALTSSIGACAVPNGYAKVGCGVALGSLFLTVADVIAQKIAEDPSTPTIKSPSFRTLLRLPFHLQGSPQI
jgi:hypothetical protein